MTDQINLNIISALNCEAKAIIDRFKLKKIDDKPFVRFAGKASFESGYAQCSVLISGIGAINMATAVGWLAAQQKTHDMQADQSQLASVTDSIWLNLGIAGHGQMALGEAFIVSASQDLLSSKTYYPPQVARRSVALSPCMSLNAPSTDYPETGGLDMECAAFFRAAARFTEAEYVQSFKVVSDTPQDSLENLNAESIHALMQPQSDNVIAYLNALMRLFVSIDSEINAHTAKVRAIQANKQLVPRVRATHSQLKQFESLVAKLVYLLSPNEYESFIGEISQLSDIKTVLKFAAESVNHHLPKLEDETQAGRELKSKQETKPTQA